MKHYTGVASREVPQEIYHCGNEECPSCNMVKEEMNRQLQNYGKN